MRHTNARVAPVWVRGQPCSGCAGVGTVDDGFQSLDYLDQRGHVGDLIEGWGFELRQQRADLLLGNAVQDRFHTPQTAGGRFQHVEDLLLLLDVPHQVRLVGMAVLAQLNVTQRAELDETLVIRDNDKPLAVLLK